MGQQLPVPRGQTGMRRRCERRLHTTAEQPYEQQREPEPRHRLPSKALHCSICFSNSAEIKATWKTLRQRGGLRSLEHRAQSADPRPPAGGEAGFFRRLFDEVSHVPSAVDDANARHNFGSQCRWRDDRSGLMHLICRCSMASTSVVGAVIFGLAWQRFNNTREASGVCLGSRFCPAMTIRPLVPSENAKRWHFFG